VGKKAPIDKFCRGSFGAVCERERRWSHGDNSERSLSLVLRWRRSSSVELALTRTVAAFESGRRRWRLNRWHAALRTRCRRRRTRVKIFFSSTLVPGWGEIRSESQNNRETKYVGSFLLFSYPLWPCPLRRSRTIATQRRPVQQQPSRQRFNRWYFLIGRLKMFR
jgi:hypothetical protein